MREKELDALWSYLLVQAALGVNWGLIPTLVGVVTFLVHTQVGGRAGVVHAPSLLLPCSMLSPLTYMQLLCSCFTHVHSIIHSLIHLFISKVLGHDLTPADGFTALVLFNLMRKQLEWFPDQIKSLISCQVSLQRIRKFLSCPDVAGLRQNELLSETFSSDSESSAGGAQAQVQASFTPPSNDTGPVLLELRNVKLGWAQPATEAAGDAEGIRSARNCWAKIAAAFFSCSCDCFAVTTTNRTGDPVVGDDEMTDPTRRCCSCYRSLFRSQSLLERVGSDLRVVRKEEGSLGKGGRRNGEVAMSPREKKMYQLVSSGESSTELSSLATNTSSSSSIQRNVSARSPPEPDEEVRLGLDNEVEEGNGVWSDGDCLGSRTVTVLTGLNARVSQGALVAVVGSTGSGKSTLVSALLGESQSVCI